jgi:hypothetical protein
MNFDFLFSIFIVAAQGMAVTVKKTVLTVLTVTRTKRPRTSTRPKSITLRGRKVIKTATVLPLSHIRAKLMRTMRRRPRTRIRRLSSRWPQRTTLRPMLQSMSWLLALAIYMVIISSYISATSCTISLIFPKNLEGGIVNPKMCVQKTRNVC